MGAGACSVAPCAQDSPEARALWINQQLAGTGLFGGARGPVHEAQNTTWRISPEPVWIEPELYRQIEGLGRHLHAFYAACNRLYLQSVRGLQPDWVRAYLELGKGETVLDYARMNRFRTHLPVIIRPDLIPTEDGLVATELDSVPGGMGILAATSRLYAALGYQPVGGADGMLTGFAAALRALVPHVADPVVAIAVSDESEAYRPEMTWLADALREAGLLRAYAVHPRALGFQEDGLYIETEQGRTRVDVLYRFFELFDLKNIPKIDLILYAIRKELVAVTPPLKHHLEEKLLFALFHHPALADYWRGELGEETVSVLRSLLPRTWILDPRPLPPHAVIPDLEIGGRVVQDWRQLKEARKRERELVIKPSGFAPDAWGSRGVAIGHDLPAEEWAAAVERALQRFPQNPHVLQKFHKGVRIRVSYYDFTREQVVDMDARVRLCPYYFVVGGEVTLGGILATAVPADKKAIHGMVDAVMGPAAVRPQAGAG